MKEEVDPAQASVDLDALTLDKGTIDDTDGSGAVEVSLSFTGGWGRITSPDGSPHIVDQVLQLNLSQRIAGVSDDDREAMEKLIKRWEETGTFLRVLQFHTHLFVLEDRENFLRLPQTQD